MPPTFLIILWGVFGLPSLIAGSILTLVIIYGRRFWWSRMCRSATLPWLKPVDAIGVIQSAQKIGISLLGFDGAFVTENTTQPSLEDSWDYTSNAYPAVADRYHHAIEFIKDRSAKGLSFEVVLGSP